MELEIMFVQLVSSIEHSSTCIAGVLASAWKMYRLNVVCNMMLQSKIFPTKGATVVSCLTIQKANVVLKISNNTWKKVKIISDLKYNLLIKIYT